MSETCRERVSNGPRSVTFHTCGKPVREDSLCGVHLAAKRRRQANASDRDRERREDEERRRVAQDFCDRLAAAGVKASPHYAWGPRGLSQYTGKIVVDDPEALLRALP